MPSLIPDEWQMCPPEALVAGDGPYAEALALVFGTSSLRLDNLRAGLHPSEAGGYPRVLDDVRTLFLVVPEEMPAPEALCYHQFLWDWVEKLTRGKDCHASAFVFVLGTEVPAAFEHTVAMSLAVNVVDLVFSGHAVWRRSGTLRSLIELSRKTAQKDLQSLRGHRAADILRTKLVMLTAAATSAMEDHVWSAAANEVAEAFRDREYDLDCFCRPPCHRNGNLLREWLHDAVTGSVTPEIQNRWRELLPLISI